MDYLIGQRVLLDNNEIGIVVKPDRADLPNNDFQVWVNSPSKGYPSYYASHNVKPLPRGQL